MSSRHRGYVVFSREALLFGIGGALLMLPLNLGIFESELDSGRLSAIAARATTWIVSNSTSAAIASLWCLVMGAVAIYFAIRRLNARGD